MPLALIDLAILSVAISMVLRSGILGWFWHLESSRDGKLLRGAFGLWKSAVLLFAVGWSVFLGLVFLQRFEAGIAGMNFTPWEMLAYIEAFRSYHSMVTVASAGSMFLSCGLLWVGRRDPWAPGWFPPMGIGLSILSLLSVFLGSGPPGWSAPGAPLSTIGFSTVLQVLVLGWGYSALRPFIGVSAHGMGPGRASRGRAGLKSN